MLPPVTLWTTTSTSKLMEVLVLVLAHSSVVDLGEVAPENGNRQDDEEACNDHQT